MNLKSFNKKDFYGGLIFIFFGMVAILEARHYPMGTAARMGPGYLPYMTGGIVVLLGLIISIRSFWLNGNAIEPFVLRPLFLVSIAVVVFTFLLELLGLVLAILAIVVISSLGYSGGFRIREVFILFFVMAGLAVGLFVYLLKIPFRILP